MRTPRRLLSPRAGLAVSAALVAGAFAVPSSAAAPVAPTTVDGCLASVAEPGETTPVQICYSIHKPASASKAKPVPMVLHSHGWGGSRTKAATSFSTWLDQGFGILSFDQRGFGESGGKAHVENPAFEGQDVIKLVDLVATLDWVQKDRPGDPRLGAIGGSYGGGYQFVGAFTELMQKGRTRFDALAPEITWWSLNESLAPQDVVRTTWVAALYAAGADAHTTQVHQGLAFGAATGQWPKGEVPGIDMEGFFAQNGPAFHVKAGRKLDIPVLFGQGATDNLFPLAQGFKNYDRALTARARAKSLFIGYNGGHTLPNAFPAGTGVAGDPCSKQVGGGTFGELSQRFLRENLKGQATGLKGHGLYHLATVDNACVTVKSVAPSKTVELAQVVTPMAAGAPIATELAAGPISIAGAPQVSALVTSLGVEGRAFFALSVGTTPADATVVQNNVMPLHESLPVVGAERTFELPAVAVDVPAGKKLFLTVTAISDMFVGHGSRTPGALLLEDVKVGLPVRQ
jgi:ABC-2 type transport system ATP-binding protein